MAETPPPIRSMSIYYDNSVARSTVLDRKALFEDFEVIKIIMRDERIRFNPAELPIASKVKVVYYATWKEVYLLVSKDYNIKYVHKMFDKDADVLIRFEHDFNDDVFLNIVLLYEVKQRNEILGINDSVTNNGYYYITTRKKNEYQTLKFKFKDRKLFPEVNTFTRYKLLSPKEREKPGAKRFFAPGAVAMHRVDAAAFENQEELFVLLRAKHLVGDSKNTMSMFNTSTFEKTQNSKIYYLLKVFDILRSSKYLQNFNFSSYEAEDFDAKLVAAAVEELFKTWLQNHTINVAYAGGDLDKKGIDEFLAKRGCKHTHSRYIETGAYNLVVLNSTERSDPPSEDDKIKDSNLQSGEVVQHIGIEHLTVEAAVEAALKQLMIKSEIKTRQIVSFPKEFTSGEGYSFFIATESEDEYDPAFVYHKLCLNANLAITDIQINIREDDCDWENISQLSPDHIGAIVDSKGNALILKDSERVVLPDCLNLSEYISALEDRRKTNITGNDLCETMQRVVDEEKNRNKKEELQKNFDELRQNVAGIDWDSEQEFQLSDIYNILKKYTTLSRRTREMLNIFYRPKESGMVAKYYPTFKNIHVNDTEYMVAPDTEMMQTMAGFIRIKDIDVMGTNFFAQLTPMLASTVVRNKQLTVAPFPFKYLREAIENPSLTK